MNPHEITLDADEYIKADYSRENNEYSLRITSKRIIIHGTKVQIPPIPYSDIMSLSLSMVKELMEEVGVVVLKLSSQVDPVIIYPNHLLENYYDTQGDPKKFVSVFERIPRRICSAMKIPFVAPIYNDFKFSKEKGVVVKVYPKSELVWPEQCVSCLQSIENGNVKYDNIEKSVPQGRDNSSIFSTYKFAVRSTVQFKIPYCSACYSSRFGFLRKNRAAICILYEGINAYFDFENKDYADRFIAMNQNLDLLSSLS